MIHNCEVFGVFFFYFILIIPPAIFIGTLEDPREALVFSLFKAVLCSPMIPRYSD